MTELTDLTGDESAEVAAFHSANVGGAINLAHGSLLTRDPEHEKRQAAQEARYDRQTEEDRIRGVRLAALNLASQFEGEADALVSAAATIEAFILNGKAATPPTSN